MNREIRFRAWDKSANKMRGIKGLKDCFSLRSDGMHDDNYIVMQYTELKDKNGKEIYEGDIISYEYGDVIVRFDKGSFGYLDNDGFFITLSDTNLSIFEIKGNVYE